MKSRLNNNLNSFRKRLEEITDEEIFKMMDDIKKREEEEADFDFFACNLYFPSDEELFAKAKKSIRNKPSDRTLNVDNFKVSVTFNQPHVSAECNQKLPSITHEKTQMKLEPVIFITNQDCFELEEAA